MNASLKLRKTRGSASQALAAAPQLPETTVAVRLIRAFHFSGGDERTRVGVELVNARRHSDGN